MRKVTASPSLNALHAPSLEVLMQRNLLILFFLLSSLQAVSEEQVPGCSSIERDDYFDSIERKIYENWKVPYRDRKVDCTILIKQDWRGEVRDVGIARCSDDVFIHRSVVNAAYQASPMPLPDNKACFTNTVIVRIESRIQSYD